MSEDNRSAAVHCKALLVKRMLQKNHQFPLKKKSLPGEFWPAGFDVPIVEGLDAGADRAFARERSAMAGIISTNIADRGIAAKGGGNARHARPEACCPGLHAGTLDLG